MLVADLNNDALVAAVECGAHEFRVICREGEGLFDVDVFAGLHGGSETGGVEVLRGGDEDGVKGGVFEELVVIGIEFCLRREGFGFVAAAGIDVGNSDEISVRAGQGFADELSASLAYSYDAETEAGAGAQDMPCGQSSGEAGGHIADEESAGLHGFL